MVGMVDYYTHLDASLRSTKQSAIHVYIFGPVMMRYCKCNINDLCKRVCLPWTFWTQHSFTMAKYDGVIGQTPMWLNMSLSPIWTKRQFSLFRVLPTLYRWLRGVFQEMWKGFMKTLKRLNYLFVKIRDNWDIFGHSGESRSTGPAITQANFCKGISVWKWWMS